MFWGKKTSLKWERLLGVRAKRSTPAPQDGAGAFQGGGGTKEVPGDWQRVTRLWGQLAWLWDLSPRLHGRHREASTADETHSREFLPLLQGLP